MKAGRVLILLVLSFSMIGCAKYITKEEFAPEMYKNQPLSILVLPPINESTDVEAKDFYPATIAEPLTNSGYYVYPIEVITDVLQKEGLSDTESMFDVPIEKYKEFFGADAVMYVRILKWDTVYLITSGSVTVHIAAEIKSTDTGEVLWFYDDVVSVSTSGSDGGMGGFAGLIAQAVTTAINTATQQYISLAQEANKTVFSAIPYGHYHPKCGKDQKMRIKKKDAVKK